MSNPVSEQIINPDLTELARKTGLLVRPLDPAAIDTLFAEKDDVEERAETFDYLKRALNETRASIGAERAYSE
jgi:hypothetical protein